MSSIDVNSDAFDGSTGDSTEQVTAAHELDPPQTKPPDNLYLRSTVPPAPQATRSLRKSIISAISFKSSSSIPNHPLKLSEGLKGTVSTIFHQTSTTGAEDPTCPPRPPRPSYEWVWIPEGYWAERQVIGKDKHPSKWARRSANGSVSSYSGAGISNRRSTRSESSCAWNPNHSSDGTKVSDDSPRRRLNSSHETTIDTPHSPSRTIFRKLHYISPKTKKAKVEKQPNESPPTSPRGTEHRTEETLEGVADYFSQFRTQKQRLHHPSGHPQSPDAESIRIPRKRFGFAPWHTNNSHETVWSPTSSIRELLMGKTPSSTPLPELEPANARPAQYFEVEVPGSSSVDVGFPSAQTIRRVNTPLAVTDTPQDQAGGFFFDRPLPPADTRNVNGLIDLSHSSSSKIVRTTPNTRNISRLERSTSRENFLFAIPEHLPSSPLCPMHPKHVSLGKGFCPVHDRKQSEEVEAPRRSRYGSATPL